MITEEDIRQISILLKNALVYCVSARHTGPGQHNLCKLQIKEEIQPAIQKALDIVEKK